MMKEEQLKKKLTSEQYNILREKGTEPAFSGKYYINNKERGMYKCAACGVELFSSAQKYESGTGWPSFYDVAKEGNVELREDNSHGMARMEVVCKKCGSHLGHIFEDLPCGKAGLPRRVKAGSPQPTGKRYCINSLALDFEKGK